MSHSIEELSLELSKNSAMSRSMMLLSPEVMVTCSQEMLATATSSVTSLVGCPVPESTYGQVNMNSSSHNHLGSKIIATNVTIVNQNIANQQKNIETAKKRSFCTFCPQKLELLPPLFLIAVLVVFSFLMLSNRNSEKKVVRVELEKWSSRSYLPKKCLRNQQKIELITVDHTVTDTCSDMKSCQKILERLEDIGFAHKPSKNYNPYYNFLVGGEGTVFKWFGWNCSIHSASSPYILNDVRIAFIGDYNRNNLTNAQKRAFASILDSGIDNGIVSSVFRLMPQCCAYGRFSNGPGEHAVEYISTLAETKVKNCFRTNRVTCSPNYSSQPIQGLNNTDFG